MAADCRLGWEVEWPVSGFDNRPHQLRLSAPSLGVYYFFVVDSVCLSVCHAAPSNRFFFFVARWNRAIFGRHISVWHSKKRCSSIFDLGPLTPKFTPQNLHKITYKSAYMADRLEMFGPTRGFSGWPIQWNHAKCCGANRCCHGNEIGARHGDPVAYRLVISCSRCCPCSHESVCIYIVYVRSCVLYTVSVWIVCLFHIYSFIIHLELVVVVVQAIFVHGAMHINPNQMSCWNL